MKKAVEENKRSLRVLREVKNVQGGVMRAKSGCDLPRNRRQIYNAIQANKVRGETFSSLIPRQDTLAQVSGIARPRNLVGHRYGKWSLAMFNLTTPLINMSATQSLACKLCPAKLEFGLFLPVSYHFERKLGHFCSGTGELSVRIKCLQQ